MAPSASPPASTNGKTQQEMAGGTLPSWWIHLWGTAVLTKSDVWFLPMTEHRPSVPGSNLMHENSREARTETPARWCRREPSCMPQSHHLVLVLRWLHKISYILVVSSCFIKSREETTAVMKKVLRLSSMYIKSPCTTQSSPTWGEHPL